mmetsp:Transcript_26927/g.4924  ORF Transcript_26927/g.4924 Transcript_26927/m.4924 type:complete len:93 (-) Transcript_26927:8398-8676(-)
MHAADRKMSPSICPNLSVITLADTYHLSCSSFKPSVNTEALLSLTLVCLISLSNLSLSSFTALSLPSRAATLSNSIYSFSYASLRFSYASLS